MAFVFSPSLFRATLVPTLLTLGAGALGGIAFRALHFPAPWMSGSLLGATVLVLCRLQGKMPEGLRFLSFLVLGSSMGTAVSPGMLAQAATWPISMAFLALSLVGVMAAVTLFLTKVARWDLETAFYASAPGALSAVLAMASASGADMRRVAFGQTLRLFLLVALLAQILGQAGSGHPRLAAAAPASPLADVAILLAASTAAGLLFARLRVPGGLLVGALAGSALLHGAGWSDARLPDWLLIPAFIILGTSTGIRFQGTTRATFRDCLFASLGGFLVALTISAACALAAAWLTEDDPGKLITAFAPGALETMTVLGFALGYDPAFMSAHHIFRFASLSVALPLIAHILMQARRRRTPPQD